MNLSVNASEVVAVESLRALERALAVDQRAMVARGQARLAELVDSGADWRTILDVAEATVWAFNVDERPGLVPLRVRSQYEAAADLLALGPARLAAEVADECRWITTGTGGPAPVVETA